MYFCTTMPKIKDGYRIAYDVYQTPGIGFTPDKEHRSRDRKEISPPQTKTNALLWLFMHIEVHICM